MVSFFEVNYNFLGLILHNFLANPGSGEKFEGASSLSAYDNSCFSCSAALG